MSRSYRIAECGDKDRRSTYQLDGIAGEVPTAQQPRQTACHPEQASPGHARLRRIARPERYRHRAQRLSGASRSASAVSTLLAITGWWLSIVLNECAVMTRSRESAVVVTVAVRGVRAISAISPKKSPRLSVRTLRPLRCTSASPSMRTKNSGRALL